MEPKDGHFYRIVNGPNNLLMSYQSDSKSVGQINSGKPKVVISNQKYIDHEDAVKLVLTKTG